MNQKTWAALALSATLALSGCTAEKPIVNPNLLVIGHAGAGFFTPISPFNFRPPSSWLGIQYALDLGVDGVEIDLQLSQDSVVMLYHDPQLDNMSTGQGCVSQFPAAALTQLHYRGGWPYDWLQHEQPITLDTLLARLGRRPNFPRLHFDLHEDDPCLPAGQPLRTPALVRQLAQSLQRYHVPLEKMLLVSVHPATINLSRAAMPTLPAGLEITNDDFAAGLATAQSLQVHSLVLNSSRVTPEQTTQAHTAGLRVVVFGGRSPKSIRRILACRPDEVEVNNPKRLLVMQGRRE